MQSTTQTAIALFAVVFLLGVCAERYTILGHYDGIIDNKNSHRKFHSLDTPFNVRRLSNDRKQTKDPFNTCSPDSYEECAKNAMPHLSRY